ncbi:hypothetical protein LTR91_026074 [Friedmanniomyces endolithicus]|uniref:SHSP domain-containing protein n=1 Tax=Friedmanniomyces endolithicus TaxID=329885 RepID=A0AAN6JW37_9PEZI|nr:hypothetical protein LTR75_017246 [Friedmanniomyces endolithicus]KAK0828024.1 hypothetical protein LTR03_016670 [Friedmanniomyces endolithicus]KAK0890963.1 hypothetical protein LTR57_024949 [Friedmanniomyces endolithicus]KAK0949905.1 hypothetical protein LTR91_026074 [Friedmanniomyces endolithicus]
MAGLYWGHPEPLAIATLVNEPHDRSHQHQSFFGPLRHHVPRPEAYPNLPDVDVREDASSYLIDVEVPGIKSPEAIKLQWISPRGFVLTGDVRRPGEIDPTDLKDSKPIQKNAQVNAYGRNGSGGAHETAILPDFHAVPHLLTGERRVGFFKRIFTLPIEVAADKVTAKLEAGLLSLRVPKHQAARGKGVIAIECVRGGVPRCT